MWYSSTTPSLLHDRAVTNYFFRSSPQHVCNVSDALTNQGIALLQQRPISLSTFPRLLLHFFFHSSIEGCHREQIVSMIPHMQAEIDVRFHSLKQMYVVFHKHRDLFSVDLAHLHFLWVWTWNMEMHLVYYTDMNVFLTLNWSRCMWDENSEGLCIYIQKGKCGPTGVITYQVKECFYF